VSTFFPKALAYLGISRSPDICPEEKPCFVLPVDNEEQALFDPMTRRWRLGHTHRTNSNLPLKGCGDWTSLLPRTTHVDFLKSRDWAATSVGPMSVWPSPLRLMTMKMLSDPRPANLYIGPDRVACYNEAFSTVASDRHPIMMAAACRKALKTTAPALLPKMREIERTGVAISLGSFEVDIEWTEGFLEEYDPSPYTTAKRLIFQGMARCSVITAPRRRRQDICYIQFRIRHD
jgi:hypothetical protein